jgi:hypothetical protein
MDDDGPQLHAHQDRQEDLVLKGTAALVAALTFSAVAGAATPSQMLAAQMKANMQAYYNKAYPGLKITTVSCTIAKSRTTANCKAHFTWVKQRAIGVFTVVDRINTATGTVVPKTSGATCTDSKTGAKLVCFR